MSEALTKWSAADHLRTPEDIRLYLEACAEEDPGGGEYQVVSYQSSY